MEWLGHADSAMVRHYYHLNDEESLRQMDQLDPLGDGDGCSATDEEQKNATGVDCQTGGPLGKPDR
jgi:hypothetical protein